MNTNLQNRDGKLVTAWMNYVLDHIETWLFVNFGLHVVLRDAIRTAQQQVDIFLSRYVTAGNVRGRKVYDTRWWNGQVWYRVSAAGTVAVPSTSNHEVQGSGDSARAAVDIADSGADAGITVKGSARGRAIRAAASELGIEFEGDSFGEGWHVLIRGIYRDVPGNPAATPAPAPAPASKAPNVKATLKSWNWNGIAAMLRATGRYRGNNVPGPVMFSAFQDFLNDGGYAKRALGHLLKLDGDPGDDTAGALQAWLKWGPSGGYTGDIDAWLGDGSHAAWNRAEAANYRAFPGR
jgi:hypothetical protein